MFDNFFNKNQTDKATDGQLSEKSSSRNYLPFIMIGVTVFILLIIGILIIRPNLFKQPPSDPLIIETTQEEVNEEPEKPEFTGLVTAEDIITYRPDLATDEEVEYLVFQDFYHPYEEVNDLFIGQYSLPTNIKTDTINYYDLARKINLDPIINDLDNQGFATLDNPWESEVKDFYSALQKLESRDIPLFISSDFIIYYYNLNLKQAYQDIEASFFYDSLWRISLTLYNSLRHQYETHLAEIGNINDPILESERLALAYFAVALELLKPQSNQIESVKNPDENKFNLSDLQTFQFNLPSYLLDDVSREVELIRAASRVDKSPVLFYDRDYREFAVPLDYRQNVRQNNFYLAARWFNSLFPLNYRQESCPDCLLDKYDWRINLTASMIITQEISNNIWLKAEWARIYKLIYFFQGLRDNLTYLHYQRDFSQLFEGATIATALGDGNPQAENNLEKLRTSLLGHRFDPLQGGLDPEITDQQPKIGFRLLAESFGPLDYINQQLTYPKVSLYLNDLPSDNNVTACRLDKSLQRCLSFSGDPFSFFGIGSASDYWQENTAYQNYSDQINSLRGEANRALEQRHNAYWALLGSLNRHLINFNPAVTSFGQKSAWQAQSLDSARAALIDSQLPMDQFSYRESNVINGSLSLNTADVPEHIYIEPAINLINDLLANIRMLSNMLTALGVESKSGFINSRLYSAANNLAFLSSLATKTANQEELTEEDRLILSNFVKLYRIDKLESKRLVSSGYYRGSLTQDLSELKFLILLYPTKNKPIIVLSPIFYLNEKQ